MPNDIALKSGGVIIALKSTIHLPLVEVTHGRDIMQKARPILIFDSGVGGLSIYQAVKQRLPGLEVVYCSDSKGFPYGPRQEDDVVQRTCYFLQALTERYHPSLAIIACNTASTVALPSVRQMLNIPVVGVVPAIKTAAELSVSRRIGLLATPGTVCRAYTDRLIANFASDCEVIRVGSSDLVHMAEDVLRGKTINQQALHSIVAPFFQGSRTVDAIVLGCTHFPLLKKKLQHVAPSAVTWVDSGHAIARRVETLLGSGSAYVTGSFTGGNDTYIDTLHSTTLSGTPFTRLSELGFFV